MDGVIIFIIIMVADVIMVIVIGGGDVAISIGSRARKGVAVPKFSV
jgi:hypothetical protein